ncbi:hypothetical protein BC835DRAFT_1509395 [Cytidiella melzeri]|nr:hypothetical protein BC835DRAFT_1509395 [Cytidiella melzeri]
MSRIPQPPSRNTARTPSKAPPTPSSRTGASNASSSSRKPPPSPTPVGRTLRPQISMKSVKPAPSPQESPVRRAPAKSKSFEDEPPGGPSPPPMSIREQIALKRAEAKKAMSKSLGSGAGFDDFSSLVDALPAALGKPEEDAVDLGRWSVKETIERARSTGAINLASRALPCLPSALFEIHLGIKPEPLTSVPVEPPITTSSSDESSASRRRAGSHNAPSWYEAQDLEVLKAWSNDIVEIQPEISMFGSLKNIDLHNNKLTCLPDSFADLTGLTSLDISHNSIDRLPPNFWALPSLSALNLSHNALTTLPFSSPFAAMGSNPSSRTRDSRGDWYSQAITRATVPLPSLTSLDVSHNRITSVGIDHKPGQLPASLTKLDLSSNPLGNASSLIRALSRLEHLSELTARQADLGDDSFPVNTLSEAYTPFPVLSLLDLEETRVTRPVIEAAFPPASLKRTVEYEMTTEPPKKGVVRIIVGKRVVREAWELEAERKMKLRTRHMTTPQVDDNAQTATANNVQTLRATNEPEAEQAPLTEGARRRAMAVAAAASLPSPSKTPSSSQPQATAVEKEAWEIEAEQGLLTAGGRRRARAAAASVLSVSPSQTPTPPASTASSPTPSASALSSPQYYSASTQTLTLPPTAALPKASHMRSFSLAAKVIPSSSSAHDIGIPTPTLPLAAIVLQPLSHNLKSLILTNRRMDPSFNLPADVGGPFLPRLEELNLENCSLADSVAVSRSQDVVGGDAVTLRTHVDLLPLLARLFPSLRTLDLSYNALTSASITKDFLSGIVLGQEAEDNGKPHRPGLRHLRLRGNALTELDGFQGVAEAFKGHREVSEWKLEELDLRDNEIGRLPPEMGLLPMDVFLVDGNVFRVPARRVWEREGTRGLLSWLRGRIE